MIIAGTCEFEKLESGFWFCRTCGIPTRRQYESPPKRRCEPPGERQAYLAAHAWSKIDGTKRPNSPPPLYRQIFNFTIASIGHAMAGLPTCTQAEIDHRHSICKGCELFTPSRDNPELGVCSHPKCGCTVTKEYRFVSKIGWKDQTCPLGKWPKLD